MLYALILLAISGFLHPPDIPETPTHDFHVSLCEMNYEEKRNALEISLHVFADDIEKGLEQKGIDALHLGTAMETDSANYWLNKYLGDHFRLSIKGNELEWNFLGKENTDDFMGLWCYFEILEVPPTGEIEIVNDILFELFDDQRNILHFSRSGTMQGSMYFQPDDRIKSITLQ